MQVDYANGLFLVLYVLFSLKLLMKEHKVFSIGTQLTFIDYKTEFYQININHLKFLYKTIHPLK
jgi:hypothetical protein